MIGSVVELRCIRNSVVLELRLQQRFGHDRYDLVLERPNASFGESVGVRARCHELQLHAFLSGKDFKLATGEGALSVENQCPRSRLHIHQCARKDIDKSLRRKVLERSDDSELTLTSR